MTKVFNKWWLAKIAASIHFKDHTYSACFFYMAGRLDYWKCQKKEWSAKMLSFHHSLKLRYMFAKQVASIGIQWLFLQLYLATKAWWVSLPVRWIECCHFAHPKGGFFRDHKRGKKERLHWTGWNLKKRWDGSSFFFPEIFGWLKEMKMIQWSWLPESCHLTKKIPKRTYWLGVCPEMSHAKESLSCSKRKSKMRKNGNFDTWKWEKWYQEMKTKTFWFQLQGNTEEYEDGYSIAITGYRLSIRKIR